MSVKEKRLFYGPDPAVLIKNTLFVKGPSSKVLRLIRGENGKFEEVNNYGGEVLKPIEIPDGDATILSHCSKYYHTNTEEAELDLQPKN